MSLLAMILIAITINNFKETNREIAELKKAQIVKQEVKAVTKKEVKE